MGMVNSRTVKTVAFSRFFFSDKTNLPFCTRIQSVIFKNTNEAFSDFFNNNIVDVTKWRPTTRVYYHHSRSSFASNAKPYAHFA